MIKKYEKVNLELKNETTRILEMEKKIKKIITEQLATHKKIQP